MHLSWLIWINSSGDVEGGKLEIPHLTMRTLSAAEMLGSTPPIVPLCLGLFFAVHLPPIKQDGTPGVVQPVPNENEDTSQLLSVGNHFCTMQSLCLGLVRETTPNK